MHEVLVNRLGGLSLPRKSVVRLTDRPDMTLDVYRGRKTTNQQQKSTTPTRTCCKRNRPLPYCNQNCRTPRHWKFTQHLRTTRPPPSLWETARYRLKYCLKGPLNPKQPTNQLSQIKRMIKNCMIWSVNYKGTSTHILLYAIKQTTM